MPQAYANAQDGVKKLTTETGAGQWGSALAFACSLFGLECEVFMVGYNTADQDAFFAQATGAIFSALTSGSVGPERSADRTRESRRSAALDDLERP